MIPIIDIDNKTEFELISYQKPLSFLDFFQTAASDIESISFYKSTISDSYEIKAFITDVFYKYYKAKITVGFPLLMAAISKSNNVIAALGLRDAGSDKLFLEQYLDKSIEDAVSDLVGSKIKREEIIEIGSLASNKKGAARFLYISLAAYLKKCGYKYAVLTGTEYLQKYFKKAGLKPRIIADAHQSDLIDKSTNWGSYYKSNPKVMIIDVASGYRVLNLFLGISVIPSLEKLYPHLSYE